MRLSSCRQRQARVPIKMFLFALYLLRLTVLLNLSRDLKESPTILNIPECFLIIRTLSKWQLCFGIMFRKLARTLDAIFVAPDPDLKGQPTYHAVNVRDLIEY